MTPRAQAYLFGTSSCLCSTTAGVIVLVVLRSSSTEPHLFAGFVSFDFALAGLLTGIAGLVTSRWSGFPAFMSIVGCFLGLPLAYVGLFPTVLIFFPSHL